MDNIQGIPRVVCEQWTRVMGYHRPVSSWNLGKQQEHKERQYFGNCHIDTSKSAPLFFGGEMMQ